MRRGHIRIGVLGFSDIARRRFLPALAAAENARLVSIGSRNMDAARRSAVTPLCRMETYEELLANKDIDLVYLSLPNDLHEDWTIRALELGKHVICEKPLGLSSESVEKMLQAAERAGLLLYENIMYLYHPQHQIVKSMIAEGALGRIRSFRTSFGFTLTRHNDFRMDACRGGGAFHDLMRYPLTAALYYLEGSSYSFCGHSLFRGGLNVALTGSAMTDKHEQFSFSISFEQQYENWYELIGEQGSVRLDRAYTIPADMQNTILHTQGGKTDSIVVPPTDHFRSMIEDICSHLLSACAHDEFYRDIRRRSHLADKVYAACKPIEIDLGKAR